MQQILIEVGKNLASISFGLLLFAIAYVSNMCLSIYYNVKILGEVFNKELIKKSVLKIISFICGVAMLVIVVTTLPMFATYVGFELPEDFVEVFNTVAIVAVPLYASCRYALKAFDKMKKVLGSKSTDGIKDYDDSEYYDDDEFDDDNEFDDTKDEYLKEDEKDIHFYTGNINDVNINELTQQKPDIPDQSVLDKERIIKDNNEDDNVVINNKDME